MTYDKFFDTITLPNGVKLSNRLMMAPMCDDSAEQGKVTEQQLSYMNSRAANVGIAVTGYAYVNDQGIQVEGQLSVSRDDDIEGLGKLAKAIKDAGAKAILQLSHAGRESGISAKYGKGVYAPTKMAFPWVDYEIKEMTEQDIHDLINDFKEATRRAILAGYDGIEIHNCNHDILQQFFSSYSNLRDDEWGGNHSNRMKLPLAVLKGVKEVIEEFGNKNFILGWRVSPEEIHGENVGYLVEDMLDQTKHALTIGIDYLNVSLSGGLNYDLDAKPRDHDETFAELFKKLTQDKCLLFIGAHVHHPEDIMKVIDQTDGVYIGRALLLDPEFTRKIRENRAGEIVAAISHKQLAQIGLPDRLVKNYSSPDNYQKGIPLPGL
ncbi:NADH-dependent oxidoreductase [Enterococcus sp.]|uniref:oxidoreductase n=1 Tax=Enterococcus sp. TaxID=35783 RepID=UPI0029124893|nr:NADH-dependent oxidoreductase [Enterococcus sp.]MDU5333175.1 NADH-dependent oxidoreductase [Enterococcus sp.]